MNAATNEINVLFHCIDRFCEVPLDDSIAAENVVEPLVRLTLRNIFMSINNLNVSITLPSGPVSADAPVAISIHAQGSGPLLPINSHFLDCAVEDRLACALLELFGTLDVKRCAVVRPVV
jgi:hypothetical protein